jgi:hypothetical protein
VTLQDHGIVLFLQRFIHSLSRFVTPLSALRESTRAALAEAELEYSWVLARYQGDPDASGLDEAVSEFSQFMDLSCRRERLVSDRKRVASEVDAEIERLVGA